MRYSDPGTPVNGYYACLVGLLGWLSTVFGYLFCLTIGLYGVHCSTLLRRSLFYFIFFPFFFCFCSFNFSLRVSFHSIQPLCAPGYVRPHNHTYKPCTYHYECCTVCVYCVWHRTGTHRDQVKKHKRLHHRKLSGFWHLDPTQT